jgi:hypothetical protein
VTTDAGVVTHDEGIRESSVEKLGALKAVFKPEGGRPARVSRAARLGTTSTRACLCHRLSGKSRLSPGGGRNGVQAPSAIPSRSASSHSTAGLQARPRWLPRTSTFSRRERTWYRHEGQGTMPSARV